MTTKNQKGSEGLAALKGGVAECWFCQQRILARALFCHNCGCLQPPHDLDHFTRFGFPCRFDIDVETLEKQFEAFNKTLSSPRLSGRGKSEKQHLQKHLDALTLARDVLRNPISRARYILNLANIPCPESEDGETTKLAAELNQTANVSDVDTTITRTLHLIEKSLYELADAFRKENYELAATLINRLETAEKIVAEGRQRRLSMTNK